MRRAGVATLLCILVVAVACLVGAGAAQARETPVLRGICDPGLLTSWERSGPAVVREFHERLGADVVRVNLKWSAAEPRRGFYDVDYLADAAAAVGAIQERGMQAIVLVYDTPRWASDRNLWSDPVTGDRAGVYHSYFPPSVEALDDFRAFAKHLSTALQGKALGYSCWVEPNLWTYLYPQRTASDPAFAADRYTRMLAAFAQGVRAGDPAAQVIAGETSPTGNNTRLRTSPQRFARQMQLAGAEEHFDVFAHHPYPGGGNKDIAPWALPRDPTQTVWLANLGTLLDIFPGKPFYLTEFAYATRSSNLFGVYVTEARQAAYLNAAFRIAARYDRVKLLLWFPRKDYASGGSYRDSWGNYSGLRTLSGLRKRAYYAFAGGNQLTMRAPSSVRRGATLTLRGRLTSERMGPLAAKSLVVMAHLPGRSWVIVTHTHTRSDGTYVVRLRPQRGATWRVRWSGVVDSPSDWVPVTTR